MYYFQVKIKFSPKVPIRIKELQNVSLLCGFNLFFSLDVREKGFVMCVVLCGVLTGALNFNCLTALFRPASIHLSIKSHFPFLWLVKRSLTAVEMPETCLLVVNTVMQTQQRLHLTVSEKSFATLLDI